MTPERWEQISRVYRGALDVPAEALEHFLSQVCGADVQLKTEIESLLAAEQNASHFLLAGALADLAQELAQAPLVHGHKLGHYEVIHLLGSGGAGEVYRARDTKLCREVAIKVLRGVFAAELSHVEHFEREAQAASALNHPNIVTILEFGQADLGRFLVMELVEGKTLRTIAAERPPLNEVISLCRQVARALEIAHVAGIVHRDVKPENIIVRADGYVKVVDFGLARLMDRSTRSDETPSGRLSPGTRLGVTASGTLAGTLRYMSPEQVRREPITPAVDIFALGLVAFELATGQHPFAADSSLNTLRAMLSLPAPAPSRINPDLPPEFDRLLLQMLTKDPRSRPAAAEVEAALAAIDHMRVAEGRSGPLRRSTRTVGRDRERATLMSLFESVCQGRGALVCIAGEPGIGKTTLVETFLSELGASGWRVRIAQGRCSERLAGTEAYLPILDAIETLVKEGNEIARCIRTFAPTWYAQVAALEREHSVTPESTRGERAYSQQRVMREFAAVLEQLSCDQPVVLFLDDLHWADASTVNLLAFLAARFDSLRVLVLVAYRPTDLHLGQHPFIAVKADLQARGVATEITLNFLTRQEVRQLFSLIFPGHRLPPELPDMIHARTEGNPLFITDLTRYLRDHQVIVHREGEAVLAQSLSDIERGLPESVRSMIERKIAQLSDQHRRLLAAASVQGVEFDSAVIAKVVNLDRAEVEEDLDVLDKVHDFIRMLEERELEAKIVSVRYRFTHVLYQNALYAALLPARRAALSAATADAMLAIYAGQSGSIASELARLFETARDFPQAADQYLVAARTANRILAARETAALARRGLAALQYVSSSTGRDERELSLQVVLGNALLAILGYSAQEVHQTYARARELCCATQDTTQLLPVLYGLWVFHLTRTQHAECMMLGRNFLKLAKDRQSPAILVGHRMIGCPLFYTGRIMRAQVHFERAVLCFDAVQHRPLMWLYGHDPGMTVHTYLAWTRWILGCPDRALEHSREAIRLAREGQQPLGQAHALFFTAALHHFRREWGEMLEVAGQCVALAAKHELPFWLGAAHILNSRALAEVGSIGTEADLAIRSLDALVALGCQLNQTYLHYCLAEVYIKTGQSANALLILAKALNRVEHGAEHFWEAELLRLKGEVRLQQGDNSAASEAEDCFHHAIDVAVRQNAKSFQLRAVTSLCRLWRTQGKIAEASKQIVPVYSWFKEGWSTADLQEAGRLVEVLRSPN